MKKVIYKNFHEFFLLFKCVKIYFLHQSSPNEHIYGNPISLQYSYHSYKSATFPEHPRISRPILSAPLLFRHGKHHNTQDTIARVHIGHELACLAVDPEIRRRFWHYCGSCTWQGRDCAAGRALITPRPHCFRISYTSLKEDEDAMCGWDKSHDEPDCFSENFPDGITREAARELQIQSYIISACMPSFKSIKAIAIIHRFQKLFV